MSTTQTNGIDIYEPGDLRPTQVAGMVGAEVIAPATPSRKPGSLIVLILSHPIAFVLVLPVLILMLITKGRGR